MMQSLRARLVTGVVVLSAIGLLLLGAITYAEQRSFLINRIDQQAVAAAPAITRAFDQQGIYVPGALQQGGGPDGRFGGGPGGPLGADANLPPGTYGQLRAADGTVVGHLVFSYGGLATPRIPTTLAANRPVTVGSTGSSGLRYRVVAIPNRDEPGTTVIAIPLRDVDQTLHRLLLVELLVIAGVLLAVGVGAWILVRVSLRPLDRMGETAGAIAAGDLDRRVSPATDKTEVGRLGLALNAMLARLERAFAEREASEDRLRRFLADASHELRTPLASIRGYAELLRIGAAATPEEAEKATTRIEQEASRMGVLVEDLLTLARLDELREPIREPVDLVTLARDAADDARAAAPDRAIEVHGDGEAVVTGDAHLIHQVLANLLRNALVHTPPGTPIEVGVTRAAGEVLLEVRDHGPGLPTGDTGAPFQRFWRAEGGRTRGKGGAGLGLAIVAEIVASHGGTVVAENAPDGGARFTVRLPAAQDAAPAPSAV
ncbi:MAG TPA: HAMP domain-containing sensor histidine kinase [Solirubrobacteraceae bacterium]|nr:HAMP domain-containing sensor histidine kinase [Solirubrobacteraceae bacterium]